MDGQGGRGKAQTEEGSFQHVGKWIGHLGGIQGHCQSMQGCDKEAQGPFEFKSGKGWQEQQEELLHIRQQ